MLKASRSICRFSNWSRQKSERNGTSASMPGWPGWISQSMAPACGSFIPACVGEPALDLHVAFGRPPRIDAPVDADEHGVDDQHQRRRDNDAGEDAVGIEILPRILDHV